MNLEKPCNNCLTYKKEPSFEIAHYVWEGANFENSNSNKNHAHKCLVCTKEPSCNIAHFVWECADFKKQKLTITSCV